MLLKLKSVSVMCLLILNVLIVGLNFGFAGNGSEEDSSSRSIQFGPDDYYWGVVEVISEPIPNSNENFLASINAEIAVEDDKVYIVWEDRNNTNGAGPVDDDIFYRYFDGSVWSDVQVISEPVPGQNLNTQHSRNPDIAVENGSIYVVWEDTNDTNGANLNDYDIFYRCNISGAGWEPVQVISEPVVGGNVNTGDSFDPRIAVEDGKQYCVWEDDTDVIGAGGDFDIFYVCNLTGSNWELIQIISEPVLGQGFNIRLDEHSELGVENGSIYVVWRSENNTNGAGAFEGDIFFKCNITGQGWEPVQVISEPTLAGNSVNNLDSDDPDIALEDGKIYVVWEDDTDYNGGSTEGEIFYRCNLTSGWEDIQVISEPLVGVNTNSDTSSDPKIDVENNMIFVTWEDQSGLFLSGTEDDIFLRVNFTGSSWEDIVVISEPVENNDFNTGDSDKPAIAVEGGKMHIAWEDTNDTNGASGDNDIFYKFSIFKPILIGNVTPVIGNTSTVFNYTVSYYHFENYTPSFVNIKVDGSEYTMIEANSSNINYSEGKIYYYETTLNIGSDHTYQFLTSDGIVSRSTAIFDGPDVLNTAPNITTMDNTTAFEDMGYQVYYEFEDIDVINVGQAVYWSMDTNASWLNWDWKNSILYGTPTKDDIGQYWVNISITDTIDSDWTNFTLTVEPVNDPPVIITDALAPAPEDATYEVVFEAEDEDSALLNWSLITNASWLSVDNSIGKITGMPGNDDVGGEFWVNATVDDGQLTDNKNFTLEVMNVNDPPLITTEDVIEAFVDQIYYADYEATDIDIGDVLTWALKTDATWLTIENSTGELNGTPAEADIGKYFVQVSVSDGNGGSDQHVFALTVKPGLGPNLPPLITTTDVVSISVNISYNVDYEATDDRTPVNLLVWTLNTDAKWLTIDESTGILSGTPLIGDVGANWVNITVGDGEGGFDFTNFTLRVYSKPNEPPEITTDDIIIAIVDEPYSVDYEATDDRTPKENLQWYMDTNASWLSIDVTTGIISGNPKTKDIGWYNVNISVTDGENGWDFQYFVITVAPFAPNKKPEISNGDVSPGSGDTDTEFTFTVTYTDEDGDPGDVWVWIDGDKHKMTPDPKDDDYTDGVKYTYKTKLDEGDHKYYFTASDGTDAAVPGDDTPTTPSDAESTPKVSKADEDVGNLIIIIILVIVIIIVGLLAFMFGRSSAPKAPEAREEEFVEEPVEGAPEEEAPPEEELPKEMPEEEGLPEEEAPGEEVPEGELPEEELPGEEVPEGELPEEEVPGEAGPEEAAEPVQDEEPVTEEEPVSEEAPVSEEEPVKEEPTEEKGEGEPKGEEAEKKE